MFVSFIRFPNAIVLGMIDISLEIMQLDICISEEGTSILIWISAYRDSLNFMK